MSVRSSSSVGNALRGLRGRAAAAIGLGALAIAGTAISGTRASSGSAHKDALVRIIRAHRHFAPAVARSGPYTLYARPEGRSGPVDYEIGRPTSRPSASFGAVRVSRCWPSSPTTSSTAGRRGKRHA